MDIIVTPDPKVATRGHLACGDMVFDCVLGKGGVGHQKTEGDGKTPLGRFPLRQVFYRADRIENLTSALPVIPLKTWDGWCDAPEDSAYNTFVSHPYGASAEHLWREDNRYDIIVVLGYNDDPVVPGAGSAIFMHVAADDFRPTEGCVSLRRDDLLRVLSQCTETTALTVNPITS